MRKLTKREQQSQKISRKRAVKRRFQRWMRRITLILVICWGGAIWWAWRADVIQQSLQHMANGFYAFTATKGLAVEHVYLDGRKQTPQDMVNKALGIEFGHPILSLSLDELRESLEKLDWVEQAAVERQFPNTLYVTLLERRPIALWQHEGKLLLIDREGFVMEHDDISPYGHLPILAGSDAPEHAYEFIKLLSSEPDLFLRVSSARRIGKRRWNIRFYNGIEVMLPEENPTATWHILADMQKQNTVLDKDVISVDMRLQDRVFFRLSPRAIKRREIDKSSPSGQST